MKNWIITIVIVLVIIGGFFLMRTGGGTPEGSGEAISPLSETDWVKGDRNSSTVLVEYGDFQCPACGAYFPIVTQLVEEYGDRIAFSFRNFPLRSIHPNAEPAARAAEAAGLQGKYWEMHDMIFATQREWSSALGTVETFAGYAEQLGLDIEKFRADLTADQVVDKIDQDVSDGNRAGVNSTPTFFLNGERIANPRSIDDFRLLIDAALGV